MPDFTDPRTTFRNFLPIGRWFGFGHWRSHSPNDHPFRATGSNEPNRWVDRRVSIPRHQFRAGLFQMGPYDLNGEVLQLPVRHLDPLIGNEDDRIDVFIGPHADQAPPRLLRLQYSGPMPHRHNARRPVAALRY